MLDIDGTLAGEDFLVRTKGMSGMIDPEAVKLLNQLESIGAEVVISSSWGYDNGRTEKSLRNVGLTLPIIGYTDHFHNDWMTRGNEIDKWLCENMKCYGIKFGSKYYRKNGFEYVILDDDTDILLGQKDNFIQVDKRTGLTQADIDKAIKILKREN